MGRSAYSLPGRSDRRRRLLLSGQKSADSVSPAQPTSPPPVVVAALAPPEELSHTIQTSLADPISEASEQPEAPEVTSAPPPQELTRTLAPPPIATNTDQGEPTTETNRTAAETVGQTCYVTWLMLGDAQSSAGSVELWQVFTRTLKREPLHARDICIDALERGATLRHLLPDLEQRMTRFQPDYALISCSPAEARRGVRACEKFERELTKCFEKLRKHHVQPVLCTPATWSHPQLQRNSDPSIAPPSDTEIDLLVYIEAMRAIAQEQDVPLLDFWELQEHLDPEHTSLNSLYKLAAETIRMALPALTQSPFRNFPSLQDGLSESLASQPAH